MTAVSPHALVTLLHAALNENDATGRGSASVDALILRPLTVGQVSAVDRRRASLRHLEWPAFAFRDRPPCGEGSR